MIRQYINQKLATYSKPWQIVMAKVEEYYKRDVDATHVDSDVLIGQLSETIRNPKHLEKFTQLIHSSLGMDSSDANVRATILLAKQQEVGDQLSQALVMGSPKVDELITELRLLRSMTSLDDLTDQGLEVYDEIDLMALVASESDTANLIRIYPKALNDRLDGGAKGGHHILFYGPVEVGKTASVITATCGIARQGKSILYFINEDRPQDIILRAISNLTGMTKHEVYANPRKAQGLADEAGFRNIRVISCAPGTPAQIDRYVERYAPSAIVVDQLRNLAVKADTRVNQLEAAASAVRKTGKEANVLALSVTQAGDSAKDKLVLETGDVDFSNVGIPAQADVMVGVGMNAVYQEQGLRHISLPKNKLSGKHEDFPVKINTLLSRMTSV